MTGALEKAARAAYDILHFPPIDPSVPVIDVLVPSWGDLHQWQRDRKIQEARAVLMAVLDFVENDPSDPLHGDDRFAPFVRAILNEETK